VAEDVRRARDLALLDAIDGFVREALDVEVWRVVRAGRDPTLASPSRSRWCDGGFDVLYTSFEQDGAIAEIDALLSMQPVFPSKIEWFVSKLKVVTSHTIRLANMATLQKLGVDTARYAGREYARTQEIADISYFLGFDGLIAPSARWRCLNLALFADRVPADQIRIVQAFESPISWDDWRRRTRK
jgi:hypothetical protein